MATERRAREKKSNTVIIIGTVCFVIFLIALVGPVVLDAIGGAAHSTKPVVPMATPVKAKPVLPKVPDKSSADEGESN